MAKQFVTCRACDYGPEKCNRSAIGCYTSKDRAAQPEIGRGIIISKDLAEELLESLVKQFGDDADKAAWEIIKKERAAQLSDLFNYVNAAKNDLQESVQHACHMIDLAIERNIKEIQSAPEAADVAKYETTLSVIDKFISPETNIGLPIYKLQEFCQQHLTGIDMQI